MRNNQICYQNFNVHYCYGVNKSQEFLLNVRGLATSDGTVALKLQYCLDGTVIFFLRCRLDGTVVTA